MAMSDEPNYRATKIEAPAGVKFSISFIHYDDRVDVAIVGMTHYEFEEHGGRPDGKIHVMFPDGCGYTIIRNANPFVGH